MSIVNKLEALSQTKEEIRNAIIYKGQTVLTTDTFRSYADKIKAIVSGGASVLPETFNIEPSVTTSSEIEYDDYTKPFLDTEGTEYDSVDTIKVRKVGSWIDENIVPRNIKKGISILGVEGTAEGGSGPTPEDLDPTLKNVKITEKYNLYKYNILSVNDLTGYNIYKNALYNIDCLNYYDSYKMLFDTNIKAYDYDIMVGFTGTDWFNDPVLTPMITTVPSGNFTNYVEGLTLVYDSDSYYMLNKDNTYDVNGILLDEEEKAEETTYKAYMLTDKVVTRKLDIEKVGSVNIDINGLANGFDTNNYLVIPQQYKNSSYTYVVKFKTPSTFPAQTQAVAHGQYFFCIETNASGQITYYNWYRGSQTVLLNANTDTWYWVKCKFTGTTKQYSYSTDGINWTDASAFTDSSIQPSSTDWQIRLGLSSYDNTAQFNGIIDLTETYILDASGNKIWKAASDDIIIQDGDTSIGFTETELTPEILPEKYLKYKYIKDITVPEHNRWDKKDTLEGVQWVLKDRKGVAYLAHEPENKPLQVDVSAFDKDYGEPESIVEREYIGYNVYGSPVITDEKIASGFTTASNYIKSKDVYDFSGNWSIKFKARFSSLSGYQHFMKIGATQPEFNLLVGMRDSYPVFWISSNGTSWNIAEGTYSSRINANTDYYFNVWFNGSTYAIDTSTDNISWTRRVTVNNSTKIYNKNTGVLLGSVWNDNPGRYTTLDLKEFLITDSSSTEHKLVETKMVSSHDIIPLTREILFVKRDDEEDKGNLVNYEDDGSVIDINLYSAMIAEYKSHDYIPPILSSNGTMGGSDFAVTQSSYYDSSRYAYRAFDGTTNTSWTNQNGVFPAYVTWYTPDYTHVKKVNIKQHNTSLAATRGRVEESNDNSIWTTIGTFDFSTYTRDFDITCDDTNGCKYHRYVIEAATSTRVDTNLITIDSYTKDDFETETQKYLMSLDDSFIDGTVYKSAVFVENINIPEHTIYRWDREKQRFIGQKILTIEIDDEDARLYTEIEEVE